ncbi:MAG: type II toxin-antitoxin system MqsR family toxin [Lysobacter sp.]|nr:type II toxin-antitoxin system MqsR family toxin [Lysobacter sp.]
MEKRTPHCCLAAIRRLVDAGRVRATRTALEGAAAMGLSFDQVIEVILGLSSTDFFKSMTTHADHRIRQDVYRPLTRVGRVYLKLTVIDDVLIVSFKELGP